MSEARGGAEKTVRELLGRMLRPARNDADGTDSAAGESLAQGRALDWRGALAQLGPVRRRWDLAILCNLREDAGCRPKELLEAINGQAGAGRQLSPQVLSGRLRTLEQDGYIRHEDVSVMPLHRRYYLRPPGLELISDLAGIIRPERPARRTPRAPRQPSAARQ